MSNIKKLLKILSDGKCHSGAAIGKKLGVTRAAIWKLIQQLKAWNIEVEAKTNQGYSISGGMDLLDEKKIAEACSLPKDALKVYDECVSTNTFLLERVREGKKMPRYCLAEYQSHGRGRLGREWFSAYGKNIYFSMAWTFHGDLSQLAGLSLAVAVVVARALNAYGIKEGLGLKWPNDVQWRGKKLAGILIELQGESHHQYEVIIGVGINGESSETMRKAVGQSITSIDEITHQPFERNHFMVLLIQSLTESLQKFQQSGLKTFLKDWESFDVALHKKVKLILGEQTIEGVCRGVDSVRGALLLEDTRGKVCDYSAGEISLRLPC